MAASQLTKQIYSILKPNKIINKIKKFENNLNFKPRIFCCQAADVVLRSNTLFLNPGLLEGPISSAQSVYSSVCPEQTFFRIHLLAFLDIGRGGRVP